MISAFTRWAPLLPSPTNLALRDRRHNRKCNTLELQGEEARAPLSRGVCAQTLKDGGVVAGHHVDGRTREKGHESGEKMQRRIATETCRSAPGFRRGMRILDEHPETRSASEGLRSPLFPHAAEPPVGPPAGPRRAAHPLGQLPGHHRQGPPRARPHPRPARSAAAARQRRQCRFQCARCCG